MPPLSLFLSLLYAPVPIFASLTRYSFCSPSLHGFSIIFSSYFQWVSHFVRSYIPIIAHVSPHPWWLEDPCLRPLQHLLAFPVLQLLGIFYFILFLLF